MSTQTTSGSGTSDSTDTNEIRESKEVNTSTEASSSSSTPQIVSTPTSASSVVAEEDEDAVVLAKKAEVVKMSDKAQSKLPIESRSTTEEAITTTDTASEKKKDAQKSKKKKQKADKKSEKKKPVKKSKKRKDDSSDDDESTASEDSESSSGSESDSESSSSDESSEDEKEKRRKKQKRSKAALKKLREKLAAQKAKSKKKSKKHDSSSDESSDSSSDSDSDSESDSEAEKKRRKKKKSKKRRSKKDDSSSDDSSSEEEEKAKPAAETTTAAETAAAKTAQNVAVAELQKQITEIQLKAAAVAATNATTPSADAKDDKKKGKKGKLEFKRVDEVWDNKLRTWTIKTTTEEKTDEFDCVFAIRRKFDWEGKRHDYTLLDIKSKPLRESLQEVLKDVKGVSLVEDNPSIDPHLMFLYHDELKAHYKKTLKKKLKKEKKKKQKKRLEQRIAHCKLLSSYIDEDYAETRKKLRPMLKAGNITYDLLWALFKPNTIAYSPTYGVAEDPRCFKVDYAYADRNFFGQEWYSIEGRYLEYDGKKFGMGDFWVKIDKFKGAKKITSLDTYPLSFHKTPDTVEARLIERGKKFVALQGMSYRTHKGLAFRKVKKSVQKININGRVMIDPAIFRRINPNYPISCLHKKQDDDDEEKEEEENEEEESDCDCEQDEENDEETERTPEFKYRFYKGKDNKWHLIRVPVDEKDADIAQENLEAVKRSKDDESIFTEEDLLIASPVVLGFAFSEKLWLEFSLSGIKEIEWNAAAFDSLVLPTTTKQNLRGLVSSHRFNAAKTIDDVIQGKGKGLNVVLHGPPGVGKTLTAESIAEYLKAPLYAVSAGELGTSSRQIEMELNRIMEITHAWGAILLLDEADVFLEQRAANDVHRNALVSVFLRLLEYYQGILFLTTNRVSTFDEAFQSRIHMGIRYENLTARARKEIWQSYIARVRAKMAESSPGREGKEFKDSDWEELAIKALNGRQIKNACITAQSIALAEGGEWGIEFVRRVLDVQEDFEQDLRGGFGYRDAMRQYT